MSIARRRSRIAALDEAESFRRLLVPDVTCEKWEFAGSLRRQKPDVGDIDVVAIPRFADVPSFDMFATPERKNLLWHRVDELLAAGTIAKHINETTVGERTKWGDKIRAIEYRACCYEVCIADPDNYGVILAIKTGPAELSKDLVIAIKRYGYACKEGFYVFDTKQSPAKMVPCPEEARFFGFAGLTCKPPEMRG
jgi:DNA polymerase/3'-5' exonuclease PolX